MNEERHHGLFFFSMAVLFFSLLYLGFRKGRQIYLKRSLSKEMKKLDQSLSVEDK